MEEEGGALVIGQVPRGPCNDRIGKWRMHGDKGGYQCPFLGGVIGLQMRCPMIFLLQLVLSVFAIELADFGFRSRLFVYYSSIGVFKTFRRAQARISIPYGT